MNSMKRFISIVLILTCLTGAMAVFAGASDEICSAVGVVEASALRLREQPSTSSSIVTTAFRGEYVVVISQAGDWYKVQYGQKTGYMHGDYLRLKQRENANLGYAEVTCSVANLRSGPGTSYSVATQARNGALLYTIGFNCGWYKVVYNGVTAYIRSDLVELTASSFGKESDPVSFTETGSGSSSGSSSSGSSSSGSSASLPTAGDAIVAKAMEYLGCPYIYGGSSPSGFDCSGFTQYVMRASGYSINRGATGQLSNGVSVSKDSLQPGDLVFFSSTYSASYASHVGIYIGNGQFIHAANSRSGVTITSLSEDWYASRYIGARRVW